MIRRLGLLSVLYIIQGLPFGFQIGALPVYLREAGVSLTGITLAGALTLPWMFKFLWAPLVDGYRWRRFGRRQSWILPMQLGLALACAAAAFTPPATALIPLLALILVMNLFAATMDVAVDGLAIDILDREHLGYGNIAQVVGYKVGMLISGSWLLMASDTLAWTGMFAVMTALVLAAAVVTLCFREPEPPNAADGEQETITLRRVFGLIGAALRMPATRWIVIFIATYKVGEIMADSLFRPYLVDCGFTKQEIGLWVGLYGMLASIAGSTTGGLLASRITIVRAVAITAVLRVIPIAGEWWLTWSPPGADAVIAVTVAEHFFGGALTTAMFAFMMAQVDRRIGATHFTVFACVELWGKSASGWLSGAVTDSTSYSFTFGLATILSIAFLGLLIPIMKSSTAVARTTS